MPSVERTDFEMTQIPDQDADTSYLEQEGFEERLAEYEDGAFGFIGIAAQIQVPVKGVIQTIQSAGLWGIESDSGQKYLEEVFEEESDQLQEILEEMGFEVKD